MTNKRGNPNFKPKTAEQALKDRVNDFRVRNPTEGELRALLAVGKMLHRRTIPDIIRAMISNYPRDQFTIKEQKKRLDDLHRRITVYVKREDEMKKLIESFIKYTGEWNQVTISKSRAILKKFATPKRKGGGK